MGKRRLIAMIAFALASTQAEALAQGTVFVGAAASIPVSDFAAVADLGLRVDAGGTLALGTTGFSVGGTGFFGSNPHAIAGDRSDLYGATVLAGYTIAEAYDAALQGWVGLGGMIHARKSDTYPGLNASKRGLTASAGAVVSRPLGRVSVFASGFYTHGLGDLGSASYPTEFVTLGAGVAVPLTFD